MTTTLVDRSLAHEVRLLHDSTGRALPLADPRLLVRPPGWSLRLVDDRVVVVAPTGRPAPDDSPVLDVLIADGVLADLLTLPEPEPGQRPRSVRVSLDSPKVDVTLKPVTMTMTVVLTHPDGTASTGRTVRAHGTSGPNISLPESATAGTYTSAPVVWDHRYTPVELLVDGTPLDRPVAVDIRLAETRLHVVDTT